MNAQKSRIYRGFTLVELLVVITIIGLLAGLATGAAMYAWRQVSDTLTKAQMTQLEMALESYKQAYSEYPPMLSDEAAVMRHVTSRWKRANIGYADVLQAAGLAGADDSALIAASAVFWLGGVYDATSGTYTGFSADLADPLKSGGQRTETMMDFSEKNTIGIPFGNLTVRCFAYNNKPIIYFRSTTLGDSTAYAQQPDANGRIFPLGCNMGDFGIAVPYIKTSTGKVASPYTKDLWTASNIAWQGAKKFQLVHPGRDSVFADITMRLPPAASNPEGEADNSMGTWFAYMNDMDGITPEDDDNIVNFTETSTLSGALNQ